jgi:hypothetical protein
MADGMCSPFSHGDYLAADNPELTVASGAVVFPLAISQGPPSFVHLIVRVRLCQCLECHPQTVFGLVHYAAIGLLLPVGSVATVQIGLLFGDAHKGGQITIA